MKTHRQTDTPRHRGTQGDGRGTTEGETGGKHPEAKECHWLPVTPEPGERPGTECPSEPPEEAHPAQEHLSVP